MTKQLTEQAENDRAEFYTNYAYRGCTCFQVGPILETVQYPPQLIRVGDRVTVTKPEFVTRVGYPMSHADALEWVKKNKLSQLMDLLNFDERPSLQEFFVQPYPYFEERYTHRIVSALASLYLRHKGYGGKTRSIHTERRPSELGTQHVVTDKMTVKTGTYYPSSGRGEDYEPGGLDNEKTHVLLCLGHHMSRSYDSKLNYGVWIERCKVRKVEP